MNVRPAGQERRAYVDASPQSNRSRPHVAHAPCRRSAPRPSAPNIARSRRLVALIAAARQSEQNIRPRWPLRKRQSVSSYRSPLSAMAKRREQGSRQSANLRKYSTRGRAAMKRDDGSGTGRCQTALNEHRRGGELLREMVKSSGEPGPGRGNKTPSRNDRVLDRALAHVSALKSLGITRDQSSDWQKLAKSRWRTRAGAASIPAGAGGSRAPSVGRELWGDSPRYRLDLVPHS
jgi:hypothetical protein